MTQSKQEFYNIAHLDSYNALFNMCVGGRNIGKTFQIKKKLLRNFIEKGEQGIYLRRRQTELDELDKDKFFNNAILESVFKDFNVVKKEKTTRFSEITFTCSNKGYDEGENVIKINSSVVLLNNQIVVYMKAVSTWLKLKGSEYDEVTIILYDEVLIDLSKTHSRYLPNEISILIQLVISIMRRRTDVKCYLMANETEGNNIYYDFVRYDPYIEKPEGKIAHFTRVKFSKEELGMFKEINPNREIWVMEKNFLEGYDDSSAIVPLLRRLGDYETTVSNKPTGENRDNVGKLSGEKYRLYTLYCDGGYIGVFNLNGLTYLKISYDKNDQIFTTDKTDVDLMGYHYLQRNDGIMKYIRRAYHNQSLHYETPNCKYMFYNTFQKML